MQAQLRAEMEGLTARVAAQPCDPGQAAVLCESVLCDLALLTVDDDSFWEALPAVQLQESRSIPAFGVLAHLCC